MIVELELKTVKLYDNTGVPPAPYDGAEMFVRYYSEFETYLISVNARSEQVEIKKKTRGGNENGGTYSILAVKPYKVPYGALQHVRTSAQNNSDGSVTITLTIDHKQILKATDTNSGNVAAYRKPGRVGWRCDNAEVFFNQLSFKLG